MEKPEWLVLAYHLDGKGGGTPLDNIDAPPDGLHWIHLDINTGEARDWLTHKSGLDTVATAALTAGETRPRVVEMDEGVLAILRGVNLNENAVPEDMVSIRMYLTQNRIISTRKQRLRAVVDTEDHIKRSSGPKTSGELLAILAGKLCDRMESSIIHLSELTDDIEEAVLEKPDNKLRHNIVSVRKQAIMFRRFLSPQRDALSKLRASEHPLFSRLDKRYLQESYDRIARYVEDLDTVRERAQIIQDELASSLTDRLNKNMYLLSVIAAVFLPLGFFTGLLGINIGGIPGVDNPGAFWDFSMMLVVLVVVQILIFKRKGWF